jgi:hypothetical protein
MTAIGHLAFSLNNHPGCREEQVSAPWRVGDPRVMAGVWFFWRVWTRAPFLDDAHPVTWEWRYRADWGDW